MILDRLLQGDINSSKKNMQEVRYVSSEDPDHPVSLLQEIYGSHTVLFHKSGGQEPGQYVRSLLGQQVRVIIDKAYSGPFVADEGAIPGSGPPHSDVITEGVLLGFGQGGDFEILEDDGFVHYCWPALKIEPR